MTDMREIKFKLWLPEIRKMTYALSLYVKYRPDKGYKHSGADGFTKTNDFVFSDDLTDWMIGKGTARTKTKALF